MTPRIAIPVPTLADYEYNQRSSPMYAEAVRQAGGDPVEIPLDATSAELTSLIESCQGICLPGSPADVDPARYGHERIPECNDADPARELVDTLLLEDAHHSRKPIFGICFGAQMLNVYRGGTLVQNLSVLPVNHAAGRAVAVAHAVAIAPDSLLGGITTEGSQEEAPLRDGFFRLPINSSHHQALGAPGDGLRVSGRCPQDAVIEAVEGDDPAHYVVAVQWHPERTLDISPASRTLFTRFIQQASAWTPPAA